MTRDRAEASMICRRSWLHPEALYAAQDALDQVGKALPRPEPSLLQGIRRLRAVLPAEAGPPPGWGLVKSTVLRRISASRLQAALPPPQPGTRIGPVARGGRDWPRWLALQARRYRAAHRDNPPRRLSARERALLFAEGDLILALGLWRDGRLQGFASLRSGDRGVAEVGWVGVEGREPARACGWLLRRCAREAHRRGLRWLEVEIDSNDDQLAPLLRSLPTGQGQVFLTWEAQVGP